MHFSIYY